MMENSSYSISKFTPQHERNRIRAARFWSRVNKTETCWLWTGAMQAQGYGNVVMCKGRYERAHRVSWRLTNGEIPDGLCVLHKCDVRLCVRPDHLFLGTKKDNAIDMHKKNRGITGDQHHVRRGLVQRNSYGQFDGKQLVLDK